MRGLIAFDLDGVLYSSEPFLGEAYREAIANVNARRPGSFPRVPSTREILDHVGWPVPVILERLFPALDPAAVELLYAETLATICAHAVRGEGILFSGVPETLARLQCDGFLLAVASNGRRQYVETVLGAHGIARYFTALVSVDRNGAIKEKADILQAYLAREQLTPERLIMVGDRASDAEAAVAVGCRFIGCDYGHGYRREIEQAGPVISAFDELPRVLTAVAAARPLPNDGAER
ncbi:MAG: HAD family hydrolase [Acidobacteriota bacterium]